MYRDRDFELVEGQLPNRGGLTQDLELDTLFLAMAAGDAFLLEVAGRRCRRVSDEPEAILYRQRILADCLQQPPLSGRCTAISVEAVEREKKVWGWSSERYPESTLHRSVEVLQDLCRPVLKLLRHRWMSMPAISFQGFKRSSPCWPGNLTMNT